MENKIRVIQQKLTELTRRDSGFQVFGSSSHRYLCKGRLYEHELKSFERRHNVELPSDYREFLLQITNGGPGPYYGLESLEDGLFQDLDYKRKSELTNPGLEFPLTEAWNLKFDELQEEQYYKVKDEEYFDGKWTNGLLRISNFGCGVSMNLVVNGSEYGNIWVDDRCNDGGIYPDQYFGNEGRIKFLAWYEAWLDKSLAEVATSESIVEMHLPTKTSKPWWKSLFERK